MGAVAAGMKIGRWDVLRPDPIRKHHWLCRCACGTRKSVKFYHLRDRLTKSCGCGRLKHGMWRSSEHRVWRMMLQRCLNPRSTGYRRYGGRGIRVCRRWRAFADFFADMGPRPSAWHSLNRIDGDGHYEPGNVEWATRRQQATNRSTSRKLTLDGITLTVSEWARRLGLNEYTLRSRLHQGWGTRRALTHGVTRRSFTRYPSRSSR